MENNFYVGVVHHEKGIISEGYNEKIVLYSEDDIHYVDLIKEQIYSTNKEEKDYVLEETLIPANVSDFNNDYIYLLSKYKGHSKERKKKKKINIFNKIK